MILTIVFLFLIVYVCVMCVLTRRVQAREPCRFSSLRPEEVTRHPTRMRKAKNRMGNIENTKVDWKVWGMQLDSKMKKRQKKGGAREGMMNGVEKVDQKVGGEEPKTVTSASCPKCHCCAKCMGYR